MSRWIDADALTRRWCGMKCGCERDECGREIEPCIVVMAIEEAPSIDIVRCGECKWRKAKMMPKSVKCLFSGKDDDFCSYGERLEQFRVGLEYHTDTTHFGKVKGESITTNKVEGRATDGKE